MEKYVELFSDESDYWSWSKNQKSMDTKEQPLNVEEMLDVESSEKKECGIMDDSAINDESNSEKIVTLEDNTKELPLNEDEMLDVEASEKKDCELMDDSAINDESNSEKIVTLEENLEVISSSDSESSMWENKNDEMSNTSDEDVNEKFDLVLDVGNHNVVLQTKEGKENCKCKEKNKESACSKKNTLYTAQDPFLYNINPEDFPVNLSESSSEDEPDPRKDNSAKFPETRRKRNCGK